MPGLQPKKLLILNILEILKRYTNPENPITQKKIAECLEKDYGMVAERKAIKRNLAELMEAGYPVRIKTEKARSGINRKTGEAEENIACSDFYYEHPFSDAELRMLIDSVLFSRSTPKKQGQELIRKLEGLTDKSFHYRVNHIASLPENRPENKQLFYTIEILDEAISRKRQVELTYNNFGTDKKLHPRLDEDGQPKRQIVNPYQMVAANGRYYLICNYDQHENAVYCRLDRITDIILLDTPQKPARSIPELKDGLNLPKHMAEHLYMFPGKSERVVFRARKYLLNDLIDWFGKDIQFSDETDDEITASVSVNLESMRLWAMQYALHVKILEPKELKEKIGADIKIVARNTL
ncbi:MAG: WYL domain-containing protein [Oscillospiraceae bacterium]|nr:WYL domain-containing protein [Oscillospiraceae bacterium]